MKNRITLQRSIVRFFNIVDNFAGEPMREIYASDSSHSNGVF